MSVVTDTLAGFGATDEAITAMGPTVTVLMAWIGAYAITQTIKFPLFMYVQGKWFGIIIRQVSILSAWCLAHYLSNHLSNGVEIVVAFCTPYVYTLSMKALVHFFPWVERSFLGSATPKDSTVVTLPGDKS